MCEDLTDWKLYESTVARLKRKVRIWMIKDESDRLLSWAILTPAGGGRRGYDAQFYTRKSERGKGHGSVLMQKVLAVDPKPYVFPHSTLSGEFFKKHRNQIRFDKTDRKWLE